MLFVVAVVVSNHRDRDMNVNLSRIYDTLFVVPLNAVVVVLVLFYTYGMSFLKNIYYFVISYHTWYRTYVNTTYS